MPATTASIEFNATLEWVESFLKFLNSYKKLDGIIKKKIQYIFFLNVFIISSVGVIHFIFNRFNLEITILIASFAISLFNSVALELFSKCKEYSNNLNDDIHYLQKIYSDKDSLKIATICKRKNDITTSMLNNLKRYTIITIGLLISYIFFSIASFGCILALACVI